MNIALIDTGDCVSSGGVFEIGIHFNVTVNELLLREC